MSKDTEIFIFGTSSDLEAIDELAMAAETEADFSFSVTWESFLKELIQASENGTAVRLQRTDTHYLFDEVCDACRQAGFSYVMHVSDYDFEYASGFYWEPGMGEHRAFSRNDGEPTLRLSELKAEMAHSSSALYELIQTFERRTTIGKIALSEDIIASINDFIAVDKNPTI